MLCPKCNYRNPGTMAYCQKCGGRMDFTADQIAGSLVETAREETAANHALACLGEEQGNEVEGIVALMGKQIG